MLRRLEIESYGLIERARIDFAPGATMFTGETGSGKTMIVGALAFALGARASADAVRRGATRAIVTLAFDPSEALRERFAADGFALDPGEEATIVREVTDAGKSSVRVNGRPSTAGYVRDIGANVAEIVGQHEAQRLLAPAYHLELLDARSAERAAVEAAFDAFARAQRELDEIERSERAAHALAAEARLALADIDEAAPEAREDERLSERRRYLDNAERIAAALRTAHEALAGDESDAASTLGSASVALGGIADIGSDLAAMAAQAAALQSEATDLATRISRELDAAEFDPRELEEINARLDVLDRIKRKYGATLDDVLAYAAQARAAIDDYEGRGERAAQLRDAREDARLHLVSAARALTGMRASAAAELRARVERELPELALGSATFDVAFVTLPEIGKTGAEDVEFLFSANAGEPLRPLARVASGGELSRVLLALVVATAGLRERNALVFDEIDAGIGGATATAVGARLGRLAAEGQVVCVTHLAQLATWAGRHYVLEKSESGGETRIELREIAGDEPRAFELARMLSGESHDAALEHARSLLRRAVT